ncbi:CDP-glucose 4,6-dehydratase [Paenibacillus oryzisoli]|uniref:CDP-glucose 4,6-dehydratase n=1 Tax=Paenibacillus oryzisoli TaxID=1850517 RepID=A0A198AHK5_9BACL|nr:CDP-glucose 4,6-dehydratase [Paenibacillus oryzisoli]OAS20521.1 CDP-glucose 4,6-dehydratase [Paenibacillus oryzisoli]
MFNNFYSGKRILVTGHTGFKGSWLTIWLQKLGAEIIGYSLAPYSELDNFVVSGLEDRMTDIRGNILDFAKLQEAFEIHKPDMVFHLAAQPLVRMSYDIPRQTFEENVMGTINVLECVRTSSSVTSCICITSDKCYDNKEWVWGYRENDSMGGYDPYSASKGCAELVISSYINSFFNPNQFSVHGKVVASVRAGNVIGGGDWSKDRIIPDCMRALDGNVPIEVRSPQSIRPWQHVLEPISGYLLIGSRLHANPKKYSGGWNFGPDNESIITVGQVVKKILNHFPNGSWVDKSNQNELHEAKLLNLDCSKANFLLGWKPSLNIEECIALTCEWYREYHQTDSYKLCSNQIDYFVDKFIQKNDDWSHYVSVKT